MRDGGTHRLDRTLMEPECDPFLDPVIAVAVRLDQVSGSTRMVRRIGYDHGGPNRRAIKHLRVLRRAGERPCLMSRRSIGRHRQAPNQEDHQQPSARNHPVIPPEETSAFHDSGLEGGNLERPSARQESETEDLPSYSLRRRVELRRPDERRAVMAAEVVNV